LRMRRLAAAETRQRTEEALALVQLAGLGGRRLEQLSGVVFLGFGLRLALERAPN